MCRRASWPRPATARSCSSRSPGSSAGWTPPTRAASLDLHVNSGYRSYAEQAQLYRDYQNGAGNLAAPPGRSTHGLGLSADINTTNPKVLAWLRANAAKYGFVNDVSGEPWHWTYRHK
jgi:LAS superfamily LD-carboxypeptidase LdcB